MVTNLSAGGDRPIRSRRRWGWFCGIAAAVIVAVILMIKFSMIGRAGNRMSDEQIAEGISDMNLQSLSYFVRKYESEHGGEAPARLEDLARYADGYLDVFYRPDRPVSIARPRPSDWSTNISKIDEYGGYLLVKHGRAGMVVYEKSGAWRDGTVGIGFIKGNSMRISAEGFETLQLK